METLPEPNRYNEGKALVLLYQFHALMFPDHPVHHDHVKPKDWEFSPGEEEAVPEELLTAEGITIATEQQEIRQQFQGVFTHLPAVSLSDAYTFLLEACETARLGFHTQGELVGSTGKPLSSLDILPGPEVVMAMIEDFVYHRRKRCHPLEDHLLHLRSTVS